MYDDVQHLYTGYLVPGTGTSTGMHVLKTKIHIHILYVEIYIKPKKTKAADHLSLEYTITRNTHTVESSSRSSAALDQKFTTADDT